MVWPHRSPPAMTWIKALPPRGRDHQAWPFPRGACEPAPRPHLPTMSTQPTHEQIAALVDRFYDRIQVHPTLGPVFNAAVDDWDEHKRLLVSFWTSVVLRSEEHTSELQSLMRISYAVFCLKKKTRITT